MASTAITSLQILDSGSTGRDLIAAADVAAAKAILELTNIGYLNTDNTWTGDNTFTQTLTTDTIQSTSTDYTTPPQLYFSGSGGFLAGSDSNTALRWTNSSVQIRQDMSPKNNGTLACGSDSFRWSTVASVDGSFAGTLDTEVGGSNRLFNLGSSADVAAGNTEYGFVKMDAGILKIGVDATGTGSKSKPVSFYTDSSFGFKATGGTTRFNISSSKVTTYLDFQPSANGTKDLGANTLRWAGLFTKAISTHVQTVTAASDNLNYNDHTVLCDCSSNAITINLPFASQSGIQYVIKKVDSTADTVTILPNGSQTIDGAVSVTLIAEDEAVTLVSDGSGWFISSEFASPTGGNPFDQSLNTTDSPSFVDGDFSGRVLTTRLENTAGYSYIRVSGGTSSPIKLWRNTAPQGTNAFDMGADAERFRTVYSVDGSFSGNLNVETGGSLKFYNLGDSHTNTTNTEYLEIEGDTSIGYYKIQPKYTGSGRTSQSLRILAVQGSHISLYAGGQFVYTHAGVQHLYCSSGGVGITDLAVSGTLTTDQIQNSLGTEGIKFDANYGYLTANSGGSNVLRWDSGSFESYLIFKPRYDNLTDFGTSSKRWLTGYFYNGSFSGNLNVEDGGAFQFYGLGTEGDTNTEYLRFDTVGNDYELATAATGTGSAGSLYIGAGGSSNVMFRSDHTRIFQYLRPQTTNTVDMGTDALRFRKSYFTDGDFSGDVTGDTFKGTYTGAEPPKLVFSGINGYLYGFSGNVCAKFTHQALTLYKDLLPVITNTMAIGSDTVRFTDVYSIDGSFSGNLDTEVGGSNRVFNLGSDADVAAGDTEYLETSWLSNKAKISTQATGTGVQQSLVLSGADVRIAKANGNERYIFSDTFVRPAIDNYSSSGTATRRWSNTYSVDGDFSGTVTANTITSIGGGLYLQKDGADAIVVGGTFIQCYKEVRPATTNFYSSGADALRWSNTYSVDGSFSGTLDTEVGGSIRLFNLGSDADVAAGNSEYFNISYDASHNVSLSTNATGTGVGGKMYLSTGGNTALNLTLSSVYIYRNFLPSSSSLVCGASSLRWGGVYGVIGDFSGNVTAATFTGDGSGLTNLPGGGGNPFDQSLNTADSPSFVGGTFSGTVTADTIDNSWYRQNGSLIFLTSVNGITAYKQIIPSAANTQTVGLTNRRFGGVHGVNGSFSGTLDVEVGGSNRIFNLGSDADVAAGNSEYLELVTESNNYKIRATETGVGTIRPIYIDGHSVRFNTSGNAKMSVLSTGVFCYIPIVPNSNGSVSSGTSTHRWSNTYSVDGDFSGTVTADTIDSAGNLFSMNNLGVEFFKNQWGVNNFYHTIQSNNTSGFAIQTTKAYRFGADSGVNYGYSSGNLNKTTLSSAFESWFLIAAPAISANWYRFEKNSTGFIFSFNGTSGNENIYSCNDTTKTISILRGGTCSWSNVDTEVGGSNRVYNLGTDGDADTEYLETSFDTNDAIVGTKATGTGVVRDLQINSGTVPMMDFVSNNGGQIRVRRPIIAYAAWDIGQISQRFNTGYFNRLNAGISVASVDGSFSGNLYTEVGGEIRSYDLGTDGDADTRYGGFSWSGNYFRVGSDSTGAAGDKDVILLRGGSAKMILSTSTTTTYSSLSPVSSDTLTCGKSAKRWSGTYSVDGSFTGNLNSEVGGSQRVYNLGTDGDTDTRYMSMHYASNVGTLQTTHTGTGTGTSIYLRSSGILRFYYSNGLALNISGLEAELYTNLKPAGDGTRYCGQEGNRWSSVASVDGSFSGNLDTEVGGSSRIFNLGSDADVAAGNSEYLETSWTAYNVALIEPKSTGTGLDRTLRLGSGGDTRIDVKTNAIDMYANGTSVSKFTFSASSNTTRQQLAPSANGTLPCGTSTHRWSDVYSVDGDFSGTVTTDTVNASGTILDLQLGGSSALRVNSGFSYYFGGGGNTYILQSSNFLRPQGGAAYFDLGGTSHRWRTTYSVDGSFSGNLDTEVGGANRIFNLGSDGDVAAGDTEYGGFNWVSNALQIGTYKTGVGSARNLQFMVGNSTRLYLTSSLLTTYTNVQPSGDGTANLGSTTKSYARTFSNAVFNGVQTITAATDSLVTTDTTNLCDCTSNAIAITIATSSSDYVGNRYEIKKIDATANAVTITATGRTIDGATTMTLTSQYQSITLVSDGTNWFIV